MSCTPEPTGAVPQCADSDGGDIFKRGTYQGFTFTGEYYEGEDFCDSSELLVENWCVDDELKTEFIACPGNCIDGKCVTGTGCEEPTGDYGDFHCDTGTILICDQARNRWILAPPDNTCPIVDSDSFGCKVDLKVEPNTDNLCKRKAEECTTALSCDDGDACTVDICRSGKCDNTQKDCGSGNHCVNQECVELPPCETDIDCNDNNAGTEDTCVEGTCKNVNPTLQIIWIVGGIVAVLIVIGLIIFFVRRKK